VSPRRTSCPGTGAARLLLAAAVAAAVGGLAPSADAVPPGRDGDIAFESRRTGDSEIYVMDSDGNNERRLEGNQVGASDARPSWAPPPNIDPNNLFITPESEPVRVGTKVFIDGFDFQVRVTRVWFGTIEANVGVEPNGRVFTTVPEGARTGPLCIETEPSVTGLPIPSRIRLNSDFTVPGTLPSSETVYCPSQPIAFQSNRTGDFELWALDPAATEGLSNAVRLLALPGSDETAPAWSSGPESTIHSKWRSPVIAFESNRAGSRDIWLLDPSQPINLGTNPSQLTSGPTDDANPDWAPDGRSIAFESDRDGQKDIWVIDVTGDAPPYGAADLRKVTVDQPPSYEPTWFAYDLQAPSFEQIALAGPDEGTGCELNYIEQQRTNELGVEVHPPAFRDPDGITAQTLGEGPEGANKEDSPAYSPSGSFLAFHSSRSGGDDVYVMRVDIRDDDPDYGFQQVVRLTENPAADRNPSWQPRFLDAQVSFRRPWGRASRRRHRPLVFNALSLNALTIQSGIQSGCAERPRARLTISPTAPRTKQVVTFDARGSDDRDGSIVRYAWDLNGDGVHERVGVEPIVRRIYVKPGIRNVTVRITDDDGLQAQAAKRVNIVDRTPPNTRIISGPGRRNPAGRATFRFRSSEARSTFRCKLDSRRWVACRSPKSYTVRKGSHTFLVRGIDASGNIDPTPARKRWRW
jgi:hypothetical protein